MRTILYAALILAATTVFAEDLGQAQVLQLKQGHADLATAKASLISNLTQASAKCAELADSASKAASSQSAIDQMVASLRKIPEAAELVPLAVNLQTASNTYFASVPAFKQGCSEQAKQIQVLSRDLETRTADLGSLVQQVQQNPAQATPLATGFRADLDGLDASLKEAQKILDQAAAAAKKQQASLNARISAREAFFAKAKELTAKSSKLAEETDKIDEMKKEAEEKAQAAMDAATAGMILGIVSSAAAATSACAASKSPFDLIFVKKK